MFGVSRRLRDAALAGPLGTRRSASHRVASRRSAKSVRSPRHSSLRMPAAYVASAASSAASRRDSNERIESSSLRIGALGNGAFRVAQLSSRRGGSPRILAKSEAAPAASGVRNASASRSSAEATKHSSTGSRAARNASPIVATPISRSSRSVVVTRSQKPAGAVGRSAMLSAISARATIRPIGRSGSKPHKPASSVSRV